MKELCGKYGNGVCVDCSNKFKETVLCRKTIATYTAYKDEAIEDMIDFMLRKELFKTKEEVLEEFGL